MTDITIELDEAEVEALHDLLSHADGVVVPLRHPPLLTLSEKLDNAIWAASKEDEE
jgi:hypothetical protein